MINTFPCIVNGLCPVLTEDCKLLALHSPFVVIQINVISLWGVRKYFLHIHFCYSNIPV